MKFRPKPGQVDFTNVRWAPVLNCVLKFKDRYLVVERNKKMNLYPGCWNGISGFLDDHKSLKQKVYEELKEEVGISKNKVVSIILGEIFHQEAPKYRKTWTVHPVLINVKTDRIKLDWEARNYKWSTIKEIEKMKLLPGFDKVIAILMKIK